MDETYITKINHLINLRILACEGTEIDDISNLVNLEELYCTESFIENIDNLINLKICHCYDTKIRSIKYNTKLEELYTNVFIEILEEMKSRIKIESTTSNIILP
jgi:Leucine-rich repeat (LRR) protein